MKLIDVQTALTEMPRFEKFASVRELHALVERLRADPRFGIAVAGESRNGLPIHHVRFGTGAVKALFLGFPHCKEPICGLTVSSLLTLLERGTPTLLNAGVEWHIVPCIDPDGTILNEGWTQVPFSLDHYMRHFYVQAPRDQVDMSFPVTYKKLHWTRPSPEAAVLKKILDEVRPDFFHSLHNAWTGGAFYNLTRDIDHAYHDALHDFVAREQFPLQKHPIFTEIADRFGEAIVETWNIRKHYDHFERHMPAPEKQFPFGRASWDYLAEIKPRAVTLLTEMGYVRHPSEESTAPTGENLRRFKLEVDADIKYVATILLQEWDKAKAEVDTTHPIYRAVSDGGVLPSARTIAEGGRPLSLLPTRDLLFNPLYDRPMTEGDRFRACMVDGGFWGLCHTYQVVRLLKASRQTTTIAQAVARLERVYDEALNEIKRDVDFSAAEIIPLDRLARVQLGSGLIVLNAVLEEQASQDPGGAP